MGRGTKAMGAPAATRSRSQAPTKGVAPSPERTAMIRVAVVDEKSNRPSVAAGSAAKAGGAFIPKARSMKRRAVLSRPRSPISRA
jgi:hypothetical protein